MPLNKRELMTELSHTCEKLCIPRHNILITCGAASVIHGLRETTNDIDVEVLKEKSWERLLQTSNEVKVYNALNEMPGAEVISVGNVDFHWRGGLPKDFDWRKIGVHKAFMCSGKVHILEDRIKLAREKDIGDILKLKTIWSKLDNAMMRKIPPLLKKYEAETQTILEKA